MIVEYRSLDYSFVRLDIVYTEEEIRKYIQDPKTGKMMGSTSDKAGVGKTVDNGAESGIIEIEIGKSLSAVAKNYPVKLLDSNGHTKLAENQTISGKAFAGKGTKSEIRDRFRLERDYGISADDWKKVSGNAKIIENGKKVSVELHWYEANGEIFEMKVKRYLDES